MKNKMIYQVLFVLIWLHLTIINKSQARDFSIHAELVDNIEDYNNSKWSGLGSSQPMSVSTSSELSIPELTRLDGEGIIYFKSRFLKVRRGVDAKYKRAYVYAKYCVYITNKAVDPHYQIFVTSALNPDNTWNAKFLKPTLVAEWAEELVELDVPKALIHGFGLGGDVKDIVLFEKIAVVQSNGTMTIEDIQKLFPWSPPTTIPCDCDTCEITATTLEPWQIIVYIVIPVVLILTVLGICLLYWWKPRREATRIESH